MIRAVPITLRAANAFVAERHRHHKPTRGHKFSIAAERDGVLAGVVIVGRPVARACDNGRTAEVTRLCTDGGRDLCSFLYAAAARACAAMGYDKIQTYILVEEPGTSLIATGWQRECETAGGDWNSASRRGRRQDQPQGPKVRYGRTLR